MIKGSLVTIGAVALLGAASLAGVVDGATSQKTPPFWWAWWVDKPQPAAVGPQQAGPQAPAANPAPANVPPQNNNISGACYSDGASAPLCQDNVTLATCGQIFENNDFVNPKTLRTRNSVHVSTGKGQKCGPEAFYISDVADNVTATSPPGQTVYTVCVEKLQQQIEMMKPGCPTGVETLAGPYVLGHYGWSKDAAARELGVEVPEATRLVSSDDYYRSKCAMVVACRGGQVKQAEAAPAPRLAPVPPPAVAVLQLPVVVTPTPTPCGEQVVGYEPPIFPAAPGPDSVLVGSPNVYVQPGRPITQTVPCVSATPEPAPVQFVAQYDLQPLPVEPAPAASQACAPVYPDSFWGAFCKRAAPLQCDV